VIMQSMALLKILCTLTVAALLLLLPSASIAQAEIHVVGGLSRFMQAKPGEEVQGRIIVRNTASEPRVARVYLTDYRSSADGTTHYGKAGQQPRSSAGWVHIMPREQEIPARGTASFHYIVRLPADDALTGTYWSMLMVEPVAPEKLAPPAPKSEQARVGIRTVTRTGIHLATQIGDTGRRDLRFAARQLERVDGEPFLRLDLENTGERLLRLTVWAELFDQGGVSVGRFDAGRQGLYPDSSARLRVPLAGVPPGNYQALIVADNGDEHVFGARYDLEIPATEQVKAP
jgi:hypothetical protein